MAHLNISLWSHNRPPQILSFTLNRGITIKRSHDRQQQQQGLLGRGGSYRQTLPGASWATSKLATSPARTRRQTLCRRRHRSQIQGRSHRCQARPYLLRPILRLKMAQVVLRRLQILQAIPHHPTMVAVLFSSSSSSPHRISHWRTSRKQQQWPSGTCLAPYRLVTCLGHPIMLLTQLTKMELLLNIPSPSSNQRPLRLQTSLLRIALAHNKHRLSKRQATQIVHQHQRIRLSPTLIGRSSPPSAREMSVPRRRTILMCWIPQEPSSPTILPLNRSNR